MFTVVKGQGYALQADMLRNLQKTSVSTAEYAQRTQGVRDHKRHRIPMGPTDSAFVGYAEHLYVFTDNGAERRLHLQLDGFLDEKCTEIACFPDVGLDSARKFWVAPLIDDRWHVRRIPKEVLQNQGVVTDVIQNRGLSIEVAIWDLPSLIESR